MSEHDREIAARLAPKCICITGGAGFLGRVVCARLGALGIDNIAVPRSRDYDLTRPDAVQRLFDDAQPDIVIHLAAEVGGIGANQKRPGRFFYANMAMGLNLIEEARRRNVDKFVQVGTVCAYPEHCPTPFEERNLWSGPPEPTNGPYGVAKRALGTMLDAYRREYDFHGVHLIPVNLYGPGDNFDLESSHVIPALIRKFFEAIDRGEPEVVCWGSGKVTREFLYVDDAADAIVIATAIHDNPEPINLGTGREIAIRNLAEQIRELCGYSGTIRWDASRPDGQPARRLNTDRAVERLGWRANTDLSDGLRRTVSWWRETGCKALSS